MELESFSAVSIDKNQFGLSDNLYSSMKTELGTNLFKHHISNPSCTISSVHSGHTEEGMKTIIPNNAIAKIDFRLVPGQTTNQILSKIDAHIKEYSNKKLGYKILASMDPAKTLFSSPLVKAAVDAAKKTNTLEPLNLPTSAVSGFMSLVDKYLDAPTITVGVGDFQSSPHGPNENIAMDSYLEGIQFIIALLYRL